MGALIIFVLAVAIGFGICLIVWISQLVIQSAKAVKTCRNRPTAKGILRTIVIVVASLLTLAEAIGLCVLCFR